MITAYKVIPQATSRGLYFLLQYLPRRVVAYLPGHVQGQVPGGPLRQVLRQVSVFQSDNDRRCLSGDIQAETQSPRGSRAFPGCISIESRARVRAQDVNVPCRVLFRGIRDRLRARSRPLRGDCIGARRGIRVSRRLRPGVSKRMGSGSKGVV